MVKLVLEYSVCDESCGCFYNVHTFNYSSLEKAQEDFLELLVNSKYSFFFLERELYTENFAYQLPDKRIIHEIPISTLEEWFERNLICNKS